MQYWAAQVEGRCVLRNLDEFAAGKMDANRLDRLSLSNNQSDRWAKTTLVEKVRAEASDALDHLACRMPC